jgi:spore coat polysaccharide biosynthesis predicted glycosyltransferase SpsG
MIGRYPEGSSWVIVDHYALGGRWERMVREGGHRILAIDDFRDRRHAADILVGDSAEAFDPGLNSCPGDPRQLSGPDYALVDSEFSVEESMAPGAGRRSRSLVSYGGSDPTGETAKALQAFRLLRQDESISDRIGQIDVVLGPTNLEAADVSAFAREVEGVIVHRAPTSLAPLMAGADLVLTAGGHTMVEAVALRRRCLVTVTSDNQLLLVNRLMAVGAIRALGRHTIVTADDVAMAVINHLQGVEHLAGQSERPAIFDFDGARRVSAVMQAMSDDYHPGRPRPDRAGTGK